MSERDVAPIAVTLDVDWAPDFVIEQVAQRLREHRVRATWFVTHDSPAVRRLRGDPDLFELGIHPNFLQGSTHGSTPEQVLETCLEMVPDATGMRSHSLVQSTPLLDAVIRTGRITYDASLLLMSADHVEAFDHTSEDGVVRRVPYVWEDDFEAMRNQPRWTPDRVLQLSGLRIFDFHPIHIALNAGPPATRESGRERLRAAFRSKPVLRVVKSDEDGDEAAGALVAR